MKQGKIVPRRPEARDAEPLARVSIETWHATYGPLAPPGVLEYQTLDERKRVW